MKARIMLAIFLILTTGSLLNAQIARQTGVISGTVVDNEGSPIPGVNVSASGPSLMGTATDVTNEEGSFRMPGLPPGNYTVTAELQGFKKVIRENVVVRLGMVVTLNLQTEPATLEEEVTVIAPSPVVDVKSSKIATNLSNEIMQSLPLSRDFYDIFAVVPGVASNVDAYNGTIYGASSRSLSGTVVNWQVDGVHANELAWGGPIGVPQFDVIEEVEIIGGGMPAEIGNTGGAYVNVVSKSGGNEFSGSAQVFHTSEGLVQTLYTDEQLDAMNIARPEAPIYSWDGSGTLGGPIVKDRIWFFTSLGLNSLKTNGNFIPTTILGKSYGPYDYTESYWRGMAKITSQLSRSLRLFVMFHGELENSNVFPYGKSPTTAFEANFGMENNYRIMTTGNLTWILNPDTIADFRLGYVRRWYPITTHEESDANVGMRDLFTGYSWNGVNSWESSILLQTAQTSARIAHFMDNLLGGDHEVVAGVEFEWGEQYYGYERTNPLTWYYYNGNPYYYRGFYNLDGPHPVFGDGRVQFANCGPNPGDSEKAIDLTQWGAYVQDAFNIRNRLVINAGLRLDYYDGNHGSSVNGGTSGLSFEIGQSFEPLIGFNPYGPFEMDSRKGVVSFVKLSPRVGLSYDIFGDGKTAFKVAYSRYYDQLTINQFDGISPSVCENYSFNWFDLNQNGQLDSPGIDRYDARSGLGQFSQPSWDYLLDRVDPDLDVAHYDEIMASIDHELFSNFSVKLQYIYKKGSGFPGNLWGQYTLYDRDTQKYWFSYERAPDWWVPFTTIIPAYGDYPEQKVTLYFRSQDSPWNRQYTREYNIPESKSEYNAFELSFNKRYSNGWTLGGSVVYSQYKAFFPNGTSANEFVNGYGLAASPLNVKIFGSFEIPFGFVSSFFLQHRLGMPFNRTVTVVPPSDWAASHNTILWSETVNVEERGSRRNFGITNVDLRLEKTFPVLTGKIGFFMDVYNLFGNVYTNVEQNPGGTWYPEGENSAAGRFEPGYFYGRIRSIDATRIFKFSIRFLF